MNEKIGHLGMFSLPTAVLCLLPGCGDGGGGKDADAEAPDAPAEDVETEADVQPEENPGDPPAEDVVTEGDCTPSCAGRECGLDPVCGTQSCGTCAPDDVCNDATGLCEPRPPSQYSTLYVWHPEALLDDTAHVREQLWSIVGELGLTDLLVYCCELSPMDREDAWVDFMTDAHARDVRIWCEMSGNYPWDSFLARHETTAQSVLRFNQLHPTLKFQGFALDIEYVAGSCQERYDWLHGTYFPTMKGWSSDGETLVDQGLRIYFYDDALVPGLVTQEAWEAVAGDVDLMELQSYGGTAEDIIEKGDGSGTSRAGLCETLGKDYTVVVELNRYDTYRGDHALGWTDEPVVRTILDAVHAHFDGRPRYRGLCLHADRGVALRHLVHSMSVDGSTFDVDLIWAMGSGVPEELRIESAGMTSQTFTPEPNVLYPLGFTDYQPGSTVDIIATRVIDGHGPTLVMSFVP